MLDIPDTLKVELEERIREQIACEVRGEVSLLYEFTLPVIRTCRIAERDDEPELSLVQLGKFVGFVHEAEVQLIHVEQFHPSVERFSGCPAAVVISKVRYNGHSDPCVFRCIWVYSKGTWFTTALGKIWFGASFESLSSPRSVADRKPKKRRRPRICPPPGMGKYVGGEILEAISEQEKAGRPVAPLVYPVMPPDTPPDVIAAMRESGALPPLSGSEPPSADDQTAPPSH